MILKMFLKFQGYVGDTMEFYNGRCANNRCASILVLKDVKSSRLGILSFFYTLIDTHTTLVYTINKSIDVLSFPQGC